MCGGLRKHCVYTGVPEYMGAEVSVSVDTLHSLVYTWVHSEPMSVFVCLHCICGCEDVDTRW